MVAPTELHTFEGIYTTIIPPPHIFVNIFLKKGIYLKKSGNIPLFIYHKI